ncbi:MAG: ribbon-helix-helix protein, CopG family [Deltaproteobacteria bacterium]|nr:ribbon-helix-helix protein, CopG family [Deltaproteobacteria bacterium]
MRTTIEMTDEQRAKLLHLAARRGVKGFSAIVQEALDQYLKSTEGKEAEVQAALAVRGSLKGKEAERLAETSRRLREAWR